VLGSSLDLNVVLGSSLDSSLDSSSNTVMLGSSFDWNVVLGLSLDSSFDSSSTTINHAMAGSFERIAGAKEENTIFGPISRFWESPLRHLLVKEEAPQYLVTIREILNSDEIIIPTPNQVAGFRSQATDPDCEPGEHWI